MASDMTAKIRLSAQAKEIAKHAIASEWPEDRMVAAIKEGVYTKPLLEKAIEWYRWLS